MPRDLPLSNGRLLVNFDSDYNLRDIYYPHVGKANHAYNRSSRIGIWASGTFQWLNGQGWKLDLDYQDNTIVTKVTATNRKLGVVVTIQDAVDSYVNVLVRRIAVSNTLPRHQEILLFLELDLALWGTDVGDSIFYHPERRAVVAYKDNCYLLMNSAANGAIGLDNWAFGNKPCGEGPGTRWDGPAIESRKDGENGVPQLNSIAFGSVDCVGMLNLGGVPPGETSLAYSWIAVGENLNEVLTLDRQVSEESPEALLKRTTDYWQAWVAKESNGGSNSEKPQAFADYYARSLLVIRAQTDHEGGIIAACDSNISSPYRSHQRQRRSSEEVTSHEHEHYSYVWPRDGALAALALVRSGYGELSHQFICFCARVLSRDEENDWGYMLQRYQATGHVASNAIPWIDDRGNQRLPIQEDESALLLYLLWEHYKKCRDFEFIAGLYSNFIKPIGNFLREYREPHTGLPGPSQDLWEERDGVHAFTGATVWAGLQAAGRFTEMFGENDLAQGYRHAAAELKDATERFLYDEEEGRLLRRVQILPDGKIQPDKVVDASLSGLFYFDMFDVADQRIKRTMESVIEQLSVRTKIGGIARYWGDEYQTNRKPGDTVETVPGNPWFICTLWVAQYYIRKAQSLEDLEPARERIEWDGKHSLASHVLGEQLDPYSGDPVTTSPLTWSHATLVLAINEYSDKYKELSR